MSRKLLKPGTGILRPQKKKGENAVNQPDIKGWIMVPLGYDPEVDGPILNLSMWAIKGNFGGTFFSTNVITEAEYNARAAANAKKHDDENDSLQIINKNLLS
jgi:hypothetical protein